MNCSSQPATPTNTSSAPLLFRLDSDTGAVVARLSVEPAEFWVADESPEHFNFSPETLGASSVRMVMIVEDPDAAFARAVAAVATIVVPVDNQYGWCLGRIADPFGHHWEIGKPAAETSQLPSGKIKKGDRGRPFLTR